MRRVLFQLGVLVVGLLIVPLAHSVVTYIEVTSNANSGAGTLRAAITQANGSANDREYIRITLPAGSETIALTSALPVIRRSLSIIGNGQRITISDQTGLTNPVFEIQDTANPADVAFSSLTITGSLGAAIKVYDGDDSFTCTYCILENNKRGIEFNGSGWLIFNLSIARNNSVSGGRGGGLAIDTSAGTVRIDSSSVTGNTASGEGGGIYLINRSASWSATIKKSTISGNQSTTGGAGLYLSGKVSITNSTIAENLIPSGSGGGGGLDIAAGSDVRLYRNVIAGNSIPASNSGPDCRGQLGSGGYYNLVERSAGCTGWVSTDKKDTGQILGIFLGTLQNNNGGFGFTENYLPLFSAVGPNPLVDAIPSASCGVANDTDQRGLLRTLAAPRATVLTCDIGAIEVGCGNGWLEMTEICDDGDRNKNDSCPDGFGGSCEAAVCGDGFIWNTDGGSEACDNGASNSNSSACLTNCRLASCGDGHLHVGVEVCEPSLTPGCRSDCSMASCRDGLLDAGEECDDGNGVDTDACRNNCLLPQCGDGVITAGAGEACDNGASNSNSSGCLADCQVSGCGDGHLNVGVEACEPSLNPGCRSDCSMPNCRDGSLDAGEVCDDGNEVDTDACRNNCLLPQCGDGVITVGLGEICDDLNRIDGDGCSGICQLEAPPPPAEDVEAGTATGTTTGTVSTGSPDGQNLPGGSTSDGQTAEAPEPPAPPLPGGGQIGGSGLGCMLILE